MKIITTLFCVAVLCGTIIPIYNGYYFGAGITFVMLVYTSKILGGVAKFLDQRFYPPARNKKRKS